MKRMRVWLLTVITLSLFGDFARTEKGYNRGDPMRVEWIWPPPGNYCSPSQKVKIPCILKIVDYDFVTLTNTNEWVTPPENKEETQPFYEIPTGETVETFEITWSVDPPAAGGIKRTGLWRADFTPNPGYVGQATIKVIVKDVHPNSGRRDPQVEKSVTISLSPKPAIHYLQVNVLRVSDNTEVGYEIPFVSGQAEEDKVKLQLKEIAPLPSPFAVTSRTWLTPWGNFTWDPYHGWRPHAPEIVMSCDETHQQVTFTFSFTWKNSITGEVGSDTKSITVPLCFHRNEYDELLDATKGYEGEQPPNWFDARLNHWASILTDLQKDFVYYRKEFPRELLEEIRELFPYLPEDPRDFRGFFDSLGLFDPAMEFREQYRGRIYLFASAASSYANEEDPYHLVARSIDCCGVTIFHEMRHRQVFLDSWGGFTDSHLKFPDGSWKPLSRKEGVDLDSDGVSDEYEKLHQAAGWRYDDAYGMNKWFDGEELLMDPEFDAILRGEWNYPIGGNDSKDWSHIGKQTWHPWW